MYETEPFKRRIPGIKTLAMMKMEKNFIAVLDKHYSRQPYSDEQQPIAFFLKRLQQELDELTLAYSRAIVGSDDFTLADIIYMEEELADMSNLIDYSFEKLTRKLIALLTRSQSQARPGASR